MNGEEREEEGENGTKKAQKEGSGVFSGELPSKAVLSWKQTHHRRVLCSLLAVFLRLLEVPQSRGDGLLKVHPLFGAINRDLSHGDVAKGRTPSCGRTSHLPEKSEKHVAELGAVAVEVLHLFRKEVDAKGRKTGAEIFIDGSVVRRGGYEIHQSHVRPRFVTASYRSK